MMLPSKGYFMDIICPFKQCVRPYCHYRHFKEGKDAAKKRDSEEITEVVEPNVMEVLSSDGIEENTKISNLPNNTKNNPIFDEAPTTMPCYNPTPISKLSGRHIPVAVPPSKPTYSYVVKSKKTNNNVIPNERNCFSNNVTDPYLRRSEITSPKGYTNQMWATLSNAMPDCETCIDKENRSISGSSPTQTSISHPEEAINRPLQSTQDFQNIEMKESEGRNLMSNEVSSFNESIAPPEKLHPDVVNNHFNLNTDSTEFNISNKDRNIINADANSNKICNADERKYADQDHLSCNRTKTPKKILEYNSSEHREKRKYISVEEAAKKPKLEEHVFQCAIDLTLSDDDDDMEQQVSRDSSEANLPIENQIEKNSLKNESYPQMKKKKSSSKLNSCSSNYESSELLCERWKKAREKISSRGKSKSTPNILPVSNVHRLLNCRLPPTQSTNLKRKFDPPPISETIAKPIHTDVDIPVLKPKVRSSRIPVENSIKIPTILFDENCFIPISVRNQAIRNLFDEFCKYVNLEVAYESAQKLELDICKRVQVVKTYKNSVAVALLRIRKQKGLIYELEEKKEILLPYSTPSFTNGWTLYRCFSEYLLTDEEYKNNGFPLEIENKTGYAYIEKSARRTKFKQPSDKFQQVCDHCSKNYFVDDNGVPLKEFDCFYHWGKMRRHRTCGSFVEKFTCCGGDVDSEPCTNGKYHVCNLFDDDFLNGFINTQSNGRSVALPAILGIDCEMCYTTKGVELTRCTLVDLNGQMIYDKIVVPDNPIIDYCTRFSGITEEIIKTSNSTLEEVQKDLLGMINERTILVGHSLENDLKVLKIFHKALVDTSVVFPHKNGLPFKLSLKKIAKDLLNLTIQENESGHDSYEDANTCIKIMLWKIKEDAKKRKPRTIISLDCKKPKENLITNKS